MAVTNQPAQYGLPSHCLRSHCLRSHCLRSHCPSPSPPGPQASKGHKLNVSLFERLVLAGYPHASLAVQHRMHPQLSALLRNTYPHLRDHPSVEQRPPPRGLRSRLIFVDHKHPEEAEAAAQAARGSAAGRKARWGRGMGDSASKVNVHEVGMVAATVRYLLQQGYGPEQLVVLTPYLGQLQEIQRELRKQSVQVGPGPYGYLAA